MIKDLLLEVLGLESENALAQKQKIEELQAALSESQQKIDEFVTQDVLDKEKADELAAIGQVLTTRLEELKGINPTPVADALAEKVDEAPEIETPEAITNDAAIGSPEVTSDEAVEAIAETIPAVIEAE